MKTADARSKINALVAQIKANAGLRIQIESDPATAMAVVGIPHEAFDGILTESDLEHVYGGMACTPRTTTDNCSNNCA